jgi:hypothetical protein
MSMRASATVGNRVGRLGGNNVRAIVKMVKQSMGCEPHHQYYIDHEHDRVSNAKREPRYHCPQVFTLHGQEKEQPIFTQNHTKEGIGHGRLKVACCKAHAHKEWGCRHH